MFVCSVKAGKKKVFIVVLAVVLAVVTICFAAGKLQASSVGGNAQSYSCQAATNEERIAFLSQFGWQVGPEPLEIKEVTLPQAFDEVYSSYNELQKQQGFDLLPFAGKVCRLWTYEVTNYPDANPVHANLLICDNLVIGGDISSTALDGFMCTFDTKPETGSSEPVKDSASMLAESTAPEGSSAAPQESGAATAAEPEEAQQTEAAVSSEIPANAWPTD